MIGKAKRKLLGDEAKTTPGPDIYNGHTKMTDRRTSSVEKNAPRATIGNDAKMLSARLATPGPANYNTMSKQTIGGPSSVKVAFGMAQIFASNREMAHRPISAAPGRTNRIAVRETPGPQDYNPVDVNSYKQRRNVIPKFVFTTSHKGIESLAKS
jgi:hypothetical protein